jgi:Fic family protein
MVLILQKNKDFLRVNDIVSIQQILVDNTAGIRSTPGTVLNNDKTGEIVYTLPQDKAEILDLLSDFIIHFNREDDLSPLINLAILHFQFESIHPETVEQVEF